jgi:hypothetical protein
MAQKYTLKTIKQRIENCVYISKELAKFMLTFERILTYTIYFS